jgi:nucleotide-binding universal stress UspA family protein
MYKKILVGIDDSEDAKHAAEKAIEFAKRDNSSVVVFHSVFHHLSEMDLSFSGLAGAGAPVNFTIHQDYIKAGSQLLEKTEKLFKESNLEVDTRLIYDIHPEDYIEKQTKEENFDLVILGCKGKHSKIERVFMGTVPSSVINNTDCDVLIVR